MNIIDAVINLVNKPVTEVVSYYKGHNRANNAGEALEEYIKDLFANSFGLNEQARLQKMSEVFSYLGNNSNPPDAMLKKGDAIEIKKIETNTASLALNSSYPKQVLRSDSTMISSACRNAEVWDKKDIVYCVGVVQNNSLKHLAMVYGYDYCAAEECYSKVKTTIKNGVESIPNVEFADTNELGRVNKVDPLGITYLRVRGMWGIENPWTVFNYIYNRNYSNKFNFMCVINSEKWNNLDNRNALIDMEKSKECLKISDVKIKNPDNPAQLRDAKLITFYIK